MDTDVFLEGKSTSCLWEDCLKYIVWRVCIDANQMTRHHKIETRLYAQLCILDRMGQSAQLAAWLSFTQDYTSLSIKYDPISREELRTGAKWHL